MGMYGISEKKKMMAGKIARKKLNDNAAFEVLGFIEHIGGAVNRSKLGLVFGLQVYFGSQKE